MDDRLVNFVAGLRAAGIRVSVAESVDALRAIEQAGISDKNLFRAALQATLIKEQHDAATFQQLFPMYFGSNTPPPLQQPGGGGNLSEEDQQKLQEMLQQMLANMTPQQLAQLFEAMMSGQQMSNQDIRNMLNQQSPPSMSNPMYQGWMARRAMRDMEFNKLEKELQELLDKLREAGMSEEALQEIEQTARENQEALASQIEQQVGQQMLEQAQNQDQPRPNTEELMDRPFEYLDPKEADELRPVVAKLAARLRSRLALRQRRGKSGTLDAKTTIRTNQRFGGVPMVVRFRRRHLKPRLAVICDRSVSTERFMGFMLLLIYALQDQISRTRSFAFIDHMHDISIYFTESRPEQAIEQIFENIRPTRSYSTDLGTALAEFTRDHLGTVDHRTTVIFMGDARNNENDPNIAAFELIKRRARRVIWFNPEPRHMWGVYDPGSLSSDMFAYAPMCDAVHEVRNLRQLAAAVDGLFVRG